MLLPLLLLWLAPAALAQDEEPATPAGLTISAHGGFDGFYKAGQWVPLTIELANDGPAIDGVIRVATGRAGDNDQVIYDSPISLPTQSRKRITTFVYFTDFTTRLTLDLLDGNQRIATVTISNLTQINADSLLYGILTEEPGELEFLERVVGDRASAEVSFLDITDLPDAAAGWEALDVLVLNDVDTGRMSEAQHAALDAWINGGGLLVVTGGSNWQQNSAGISDLLPVRLNGTTSLESMPALVEAFGFAYRDAGPYVVTTSTLQEGEILYAEGNIPLLVRRESGQGAIFFLALDPKTAPLRDWDANEAFWSEISRSAQRPPFWSTGIKEFYLARDAVRNLSGLTLPSVWLMFCFLGIYVLAIGPINYFALKRLKRAELAWVTIPALITIFSLGTILTGFRTKGNQVIVNQISIAYGQVDGDQAQVESVLGLYSPRRAAFDLNFPGDVLVRPLQDQFGVGGGTNSGVIERSNDVVVHDVRVDVSATEAFIINSYRPLPDLSGEVTMTVDDAGTRLSIVVANNSDLTIENASILIGYQLIGLGDLAPGQSETVSADLSSLSTPSSSDMSSYTAYGLNSPLIATRYEEILYGSRSDYGRFDDADTQSRYQIMQSLHANLYGAEPVAVPQETVTLIGWTTKPQVEVDLDARNLELQATTLYFIELPFNQSIASSSNLTIGQGLWSFDINDSSGVYNPSPYDLEMSNGWVEFEFTPWSNFQSLDADGLDIVMSLPLADYYQTQEMPTVSLWSWQDESWVKLDGVTWGVNRVENYSRFINGTASVRIRLSYTGFASIRIRELQPVLYGDL